MMTAQVATAMGVKTVQAETQEQLQVEVAKAINACDRFWEELGSRERELGVHRPLSSRLP
jgi:hypothetical protein